jgi:peroxiredoxin
VSASGTAPGDKPTPPSTPAPVDTRRYGWAVGALAAVLVVGFLIYSLVTSHDSAGTAGVPAGDRLHLFAAPLAASTLTGDANLNPPCTPARHDPRALNVCLLVKRAPLVLGFFVTNSSQCEREVDAMQALSRRRALRPVQFAAVAVNGTHAATAKAVRTHGWTIPVAYDPDGAVGGAYGVTACPLLELAERGGTVAARMIGEHWLNQNALAAQVRELLRQSGGSG